LEAHFYFLESRVSASFGSASDAAVGLSENDKRQVAMMMTGGKLMISVAKKGSLEEIFLYEVTHLQWTRTVCTEYSTPLKVQGHYILGLLRQLGRRLKHQSLGLERSHMSSEVSIIVPWARWTRFRFLPGSGQSIGRAVSVLLTLRMLWKISNLKVANIQSIGRAVSALVILWVLWTISVMSTENGRLIGRAAFQDQRYLEDTQPGVGVETKKGLRTTVIGLRCRMFPLYWSILGMGEAVLWHWPKMTWGGEMRYENIE
jgi:hypothetical protein